MTAVRYLSQPANTSEAVDFLKRLDPSGWHNLVAIDPEKRQPVTGKTFAPGEWDAMSDWIDARQGKYNLYFSVNEPAPGSPPKKLTKEDIVAVRAVYIDVDPAKGADFEDERLRIGMLSDTLRADYAFPPTAVIDSGGGYQFFWKLATKNTDKDWAEAQGNALAKKYGADHTFDVNRIMRLPGTVNLPDATKRAKGRRPAPARLVAWDNEAFERDGLEFWCPPIAPSARDVAQDTVSIDVSAVEAMTGPQDWPAQVKDKLQSLMSDPDFAALYSGNDAAIPGDDKSGSSFLFHLAAHLRRANFTPTEFGQVAYVWEPANLANKSDPIRQITRAWARCGASSATEDFEPVEISAPTAEISPAVARRKFPRMTGEKAADIGGNIQSHPLIKGVLEQKAMSVIYGESNSGKSFVALDMAFAVSKGTEWNGRKTVQGLVVYIAAEGGLGITKRFSAYDKARGLKGTGAKLEVITASPDLVHGKADAEALIAEIRQIEQEWQTPCTMVVIDTLSRVLSGGDENSPTDMGTVVKNFGAIQTAIGCHLMVIHHSGKDKERGARGHSLLRAATDTELSIDERVLEVKKQRDIEPAQPMHFALEVVPVGTDEDGQPITSCVVKWVKEEEIKLQLTRGEEQMLEAMTVVAEDKLGEIGGQDISEIGMKAADIDECFIQLFGNSLKIAKSLKHKENDRSELSGASRATLKRLRQGLAHKGRAMINEEKQWFITMAHHGS